VYVGLKPNYAKSISRCNKQKINSLFTSPGNAIPGGAGTVIENGKSDRKIVLRQGQDKLAVKLNIVV